MRPKHLLWLEDSDSARAMIRDAGEEKGVNIELYSQLQPFVDRIHHYWPANSTIVGGPDALVWDLGIGNCDDAGTYLKQERKRLMDSRVFAIYSEQTNRVMRYNHEMLTDRNIELVDLSIPKSLLKPSAAIDKIVEEIERRRADHEQARTNAIDVAKYLLG